MVLFHFSSRFYLALTFQRIFHVLVSLIVFVPPSRVRIRFGFELEIFRDNLSTAGCFGSDGRMIKKKIESPEFLVTRRVQSLNVALTMNLLAIFSSLVPDGEKSLATRRLLGACLFYVQRR